MSGYGSDAGFQEWLDGMGYELPADAPGLAALRQRGAAYLDGVYGGVWTGYPTGGIDQERQWPRTGAKVDCTRSIDPEAIPLAVVQASYRAAWLEGSTPGVLSSSATSGRRVSRQKVDVLERAFFDDGPAAAGSGSVAFLDGEIDGAMRQFVCETTGGFFIASIGGCCK